MNSNRLRRLRVTLGRWLPILGGLALAITGLHPLVRQNDPDAPLVSHLLTRAAFPEDLRGLEALRYAFPFTLGLLVSATTLARWRRPDNPRRVGARALEGWLVAASLLAAVQVGHEIGSIDSVSLGGRWFLIHNDLTAAGTVLALLSALAAPFHLWWARRRAMAPGRRLSVAQRWSGLLCGLWIAHGLLLHLYASALTEMNEIDASEAGAWIWTAGRGYWTCLAGCAMMAVCAGRVSWTSTPAFDAD